MTKYKEFYKKLITEHAEEFREFKKIHDLFAKDRMKYQDDYNNQGSDIVDLINLYEKKLCSKMEGSKNGVYSASLAEKFREEIKKDYPLIDLIGVRLSFAT